jgi:hypothetical protein
MLLCKLAWSCAPDDITQQHSLSIFQPTVQGVEYTNDQRVAVTEPCKACKTGSDMHCTALFIQNDRLQLLYNLLGSTSTLQHQDMIKHTFQHDSTTC